MDVFGPSGSFFLSNIRDFRRFVKPCQQAYRIPPIQIKTAARRDAGRSGLGCSRVRKTGHIPYSITRRAAVISPMLISMEMELMVLDNS